MRRIVTVAAALLCSLFAAGLSAQTTLVKKSKAKATIVLADEDARTKQAAELLQDFVKRISGAELPVTDQTESKHNVFIGGQAAEDVGEDGFSIDTKDGNLYIKTRSEEHTSELQSLC